MNETWKITPVEITTGWGTAYVYDWSYESTGSVSTSASGRSSTFKRAQRQIKRMRRDNDRAARRKERG